MLSPERASWHVDCRRAASMPTSRPLFLLVLATTTWSIASRAEAPPAKPPGVAPPTPKAVPAMTLAEALAHAKKHQPSLALARARVLAAQGEAAIPSALWKPTVSATAQFVLGTTNNTTASYVGAYGLDIPRIGGTPNATVGSLTPAPSTFVGVGLRQEVFDFGRIAALSVAGDSFVDIERYRLDAETLDVELAVRESFFAVHAAHAVVTAADKAHGRAVLHRDQTKAQVDKELRAPVELARAEAEVTLFAVGKVRARGALALSQTVLAAAVGSPEGAVDVSGDPPGPPSAPALDQAIAEGSKRDPAVKQAFATVKVYEDKAKAVAAETRPNLYLTALISGRGGGAASSTGATLSLGGYAPQVPNWDIGLVLSVPLYDPLVGARVDSLKLQADTAKSLVDVVKLRAVAAIRRAYTLYEVARDTVPALERAAEAATTNYGLTEARFGSGLAHAVELADAEALRVEAEIALAVGRFELAKARAVLGRVIAEGT